MAECILCIVNETAQIHRDWVDALMRRTNLPITTLSTRAGLASTTLSRRDEADFTGYSARTIEKVTKAFGVPPPGASGFEEDDATPYEGDPRVASEILAGRKNADVWRLSSTALEYAGYRPGDFLIVDLNAEPQPGDIVLAQRYDWQAARADTIIRIFEPPFLLGAGGDDQHRKPLYIGDQKGNVAIKGVVVASYRILKPAA